MTYLRYLHTVFLLLVPVVVVAQNADNTADLHNYSEHLGRDKASQYYKVNDGNIPKLKKLQSDPLKKYKEALLAQEAMELKQENQVTSGFRLKAYFKEGKLVVKEPETVTLQLDHCPPDMVSNFIIHFPFDKYYLTAKAKQEVQDAYSYFTANPGTHINLAGHTDTMGTDAYNITLSYNRVTTVGKALMAKGVAEGEMTASFHGEHVNVVQGGDQFRNQANRRVEIQILRDVPCN